MRYAEFITEKIIGNFNINGINIAVNDHSLARAVERDVLPTDVDRVLKKLYTIFDQLAAVESGQQIWIYDPTDRKSVV